MSCERVEVCWRASSEAQFLRRILGLLTISGYAVGGWVRDMVRGEHPHDLDIVLNTTDRTAVAEQAAHLSAVLGGTSVALDQQRGYWRIAGLSAGHIDLAMLQADRLEDDLLRRDFTINALAWDGQSERLVDPADGLKDLRIGYLRTCAADALERDPLRCLRAWRLLSRYGWKADEALIAQVRNSCHKLRSVAPERVVEELFYCLRGDVVNSRDFVEKSGVLRGLFAHLQEPLAGGAGREVLARAKAGCVDTTGVGEGDTEVLSLVGVRERVLWYFWQRWQQWRSAGLAGGWSERELTYWLTDLGGGHRRCEFVALALLLHLDECSRTLSAEQWAKIWQARLALSRRENRHLRCLISFRDELAAILECSQDRGAWFDLYEAAGEPWATVILVAGLENGFLTNRGGDCPQSGGIGDELREAVNLPAGEVAVKKDILTEISPVIGHFFQEGEPFQPNICVSLSLLLQRYPQITGTRIGRLKRYLQRSCFCAGSLTSEEVWRAAEVFVSENL